MKGARSSNRIVGIAHVDPAFNSRFTDWQQASDHLETQRRSEGQKQPYRMAGMLTEELVCYN